MNLYVDDMRSAPDDWTLAETIEETIACLETGTVEALSLDYDLSNDDDTLVGGKITRWLIECAIDKKYNHIPYDIFLHTGNSVGRQNMLADLQELAHILDVAGFPTTYNGVAMPVFSWEHVQYV